MFYADCEHVSIFNLWSVLLIFVGFMVMWLNDLVTQGWFVCHVSILIAGGLVDIKCDGIIL